MKHVVVPLSVALVALLSACGGTTKKSCKDTGCSAGSVCNANTGQCEIIGSGGGAGGGGGGSTTGGGTGGSGGGTTGGGSGGGGGTVVDPFDDGGVFVAGDICSKPLVVDFDGGTVASVTVDLATLQDQYVASCNASASGNDVIFEVTLPDAKGLSISATDTSGKSQDAVISLLKSPCPLLTSVSCIDSYAEPEVLSLERVPAGTWYVLLENYADDASGDGTYRVDFELKTPAMAPPNDTCATATPITFTNGAAMVTGTTVAAFNDTAGNPLTCSPESASSGAEVFYTFTLAQPQNVTVQIDVPSTSDLYPAVAITTTCGVGGTANEKLCTTSTATGVKARNLAAGTYTLVVDGTDSYSGEFSLTLTLAPPVPPPANDTCSGALTLVPNVSQMVDVNTGNLDYPPSCNGSATGGDAVYQFTLTQAQPVRITATGMNNADPIIALYDTTCGDSMSEVTCADTTGTSEVLETPTNLPAGTYFVTLAAYSDAAGQLGISLELLQPIPPPTNESCSAPQVITFTGGMATAALDLRAAAADFQGPSCATSADGGDAVYQLEIPTGQTLTVVATPDTNFDVVLSAVTPSCTTLTDVSCADSGGDGGAETMTVANNTGMAMPVFVIVKGYDITSMGSAALTFSVQ